MIDHIWGEVEIPTDLSGTLVNGYVNRRLTWEAYFRGGERTTARGVTAQIRVRQESQRQVPSGYVPGSGPAIPPPGLRYFKTTQVIYWLDVLRDVGPLRITSLARSRPGLGENAWRDYSLWNDPAERRRYCIAVLRDKLGEASRRLHDEVRVGDIVETSLPRDHFPLAEGAERHLLLAGGIGITPVMAMVAELRRRRADFVLHYCTRAPERAAFRDELDLLAAMDKVAFHYDGGDPAKGLDIAELLREPQPGTHLYYCGPAGMMGALIHWRN